MLKEGRQKVRDAMKETSWGMMLSMVYLQGRTYESIAHTLGIPLGTVKSRIHAAKKAMREELLEQVQDVF